MLPTPVLPVPESLQVVPESLQVVPKLLAMVGKTNLVLQLLLELLLVLTEEP